MQEAAQLADVETLVVADHEGEPWDAVAVPVAGRVGVIVGPEGGLTPAERAAVRDAGARRVHLGPTRLRAETAALTLAAAVSWRCGAPAPAPGPRQGT